MKIKINELTWRGMDKLNQLARELEEIRKDKNNSFVDTIQKEIEISKFLTTPNWEYVIKQTECEINV